MARPRKKKEAPKRKKAKTPSKRAQGKPVPKTKILAKKAAPKKVARRPSKAAPRPKARRAPVQTPVKEKRAKKVSKALEVKKVKPTKGWVQRFIEKASTSPKERARAKKSLEPKTKVEKPTPAPKLKRDKRGRVRDYRKEYQRRIARAEVIQRALPEAVQTKSVARGHPRRERGEVGFGEIKQLKRAAKFPSIGQQRDAGETNPVQYEIRIAARQRICEIAGVPVESVTSTEGTRRSPEVERFAATFVGLGLGTLHDAFTLYFSP